MATDNQGINWGGIGLRVFFATVLVMATYNPTSWSYYEWVVYSVEDFNPLVILAGIILLIGWSIYIRATLRSLGAFGLVLALAFFSVLLWVIIDWGLVAVENITAVTWIVLVIMSFILGIGMSWSFVRRKMSGQQDINDDDEA